MIWDVVAGSGSTTLRLTQPEFPPVGGAAHAVRFEVTSPDVHVGLSAETYGDGHTLTDYFGELAERWRGWAGELHWHSDGANVFLSTTNDGRRAIHIRIRLSFPGPHTIEELVGSTGQWRFQTIVTVEHAALDETAREVRRLLEAGNNPASGG